MVDHCLYKGFWSLICDGESASPTCSTGIETISESLRKLQEKLPEIFPMPPEAKKLSERDNLLVFISNDSYEEIKRSAEAIRSNVDYPFIMYYFKKRSNSQGHNLQYMHTPDDELYKYTVDDKCAVSFWKLIGKKPKQSGNFDALLPSQVTDRDYIHLPADKEDFERVKNDKGGKWILHCSDLETLDNLWKNLIRLYDKGVLAGLKSCTAKFSITDINPEYQTKAILCYTSDAGCKSSVKRTAESIFICTGYDFVMYYKSNKSSRFGQYRHEGFTSISMYMFTGTGEMFEKDYLNRWKTIIFNEEHEK